MQAPADSDSSDFTLQVFQFEHKLQNKAPAYDLPPPIFPDDIVPRAHSQHNSATGNP